MTTVSPPPASLPTPETSLLIEGMTCGACVARVDKALRSVPGVRDAAVNLTTGMAAIQGPADDQQLVRAVDRAGYSARILSAGTGSAATLRDLSVRGQRHEHASKQRLLVGTAAGLPVVLIDLLMPRLMSLHGTPWLTALAATQFLLATVVMVYTARPFFTGAWRALRHASANMDLLVALGTGVAYLYSLAVLLLEWSGRVPPHAYHNELHAAVTIVVLVTLGKYLEARAKRRASSAVAGLASQTSPTAHRLDPDGAVHSIAAEEVAVGDRIQVLAHQTLPVDGEVVEGAGSADLSVVTGESLPVEVHAGSTLPGGATLADGRIVLRATSTAAASTVSRILELVNAAQASKTQIQGLADRVAAVFVPIVLALGAANFLGWVLLTGNWERALVTTIATIVIACPCAMGLATPTAITVALGTAARLGILFTKAAALETARRITTVVFDKTGTLTQGKPEVARILPADGAALHEHDLLQRAASIEQFSDHPLANAIVAAATDRGIPLLDPTSFHSIPGGGVQAGFDDHQHPRDFIAGSLSYVKNQGIEPSAADQAAIDNLLGEGHSLVALADLTVKRLLGLIALRDALRPDAADTLATLCRQGLRIGVLSGDSEAAVRSTLKDLPVDFVRAGVKPSEKAAAVAALKTPAPGSPAAERVAFVGDGINDAPALAAADLGIAMDTGTDLAKSAGDVLLTANRLSAIPHTLLLARRTLRIIRQNLFWAFAYNVAAIPLAMLGILSPGMAAAAMILSSLTVVGNSLRLHR